MVNGQSPDHASIYKTPSLARRNSKVGFDVIFSKLNRQPKAKRLLTNRLLVDRKKGLELVE